MCDDVLFLVCVCASLKSTCYYFLILPGAHFDKRHRFLKKKYLFIGGGKMYRRFKFFKFYQIVLEFDLKFKVIFINS